MTDTRNDLWTYVLVTVMTVLIWLWASTETRQEAVLNGLVVFTVPEAGEFVVTPSSQPVVITVEGSSRAIRKVREALSVGLAVDLPAESGPLRLGDLEARVRRMASMRSSDVSISAVDPPSVELVVDRTVSLTALVRAVLPGVTAVDEVVVEPAEITVTLPESLRRTLPEDFTLEALVARDELDRLEPGVLHSLDVPVRMPEGVPIDARIHFDPSIVRVAFKMHSRLIETVVDRVRVRLVTSPEDHGSYVIVLHEKHLEGVRITADASLVRAIEAEDPSVRAMVFAVVHLSADDLEKRLDRKPVAYFAVLQADGSIEPVLGSIDGVEGMPSVSMAITAVAEAIAAP